MATKQSEVGALIERVNDEGQNLSKWEQEFMESISDQFERFGSISPRQREILEQIDLRRVK